MSLFVKIGTIVSRSAPVQFLVQKSKRIIPPGFSGIPLYDVIRFFNRQLKTTSMTERASAIAFNFVMAIPPAIIFLFTLIPYFPISTEVEEALYSLIRDVIPGEKNNAVIIEFLQDFIRRPRTGLLSLGFVLSIYFSSNAVMGIMLSFDKNYHGFRKRSGFQRRLVAIKLTMILYILILVSTLLLVAQGAVLRWLGIENATIRAVIVNARWLVIILLFFTAISLIYRHAPAVQKKWNLINPGSLLAAFLMILCTMLFSYWVNHYAFYNKIYGSIGTVLILMLLIYFNSLVLLIGFELNVSINSLRKIADERKDNRADGNENSV
jgi:membrane protein